MAPFKTKLLGKVPIIMIVILILCFIGTFPILFNKLFLTWRSPSTVGSEEAWMSFIATFFGAIIGGIISGGLTLIGVQYTIMRQDNKEKINAYPERRKLGDDLVSLLVESYRVTNRTLNEKDFYTQYSYLNQIMDRRDELLSKASKVSDEVYEQIRSNYWVSVRDLFMTSGKEIPEDRHKYYVDKLYVTSCKVASLVAEITEEYRKLKK